MVDNFWLECRMTMIFFSADSPSVKDNFRYPSYGTKMRGNFSRGIWFSKIPPKTGGRPYVFSCNFPLLRAWIPKNHHLLMFYSLQPDLMKMRTPNFFLQIDMSLRKVPSIIIGWWKLTKNFSSLTKSLKTFTKTLFFSSSEALLLPNYKQRVWTLENQCQNTFALIKSHWDNKNWPAICFCKALIMLMLPNTHVTCW